MLLGEPKERRVRKVAVLVVERERHASRAMVVRARHASRAVAPGVRDHHVNRGTVVRAHRASRVAAPGARDNRARRQMRRGQHPPLIQHGITVTIQEVQPPNHVR